MAQNFQELTMTSVSQLNLTSCLGLPLDPLDFYKGNKRLHLHEHRIQWLNKRFASSFQNNLYIVKITKMLFCADVFCPSLDDYQFIIFWFCCSFDSHVRSVLIISTIQLIVYIVVRNFIPSVSRVQLSTTRNGAGNLRQL